MSAAKTEQYARDYPAWHWQEVEVGDLDPSYPMLRNLAELWELSEEERCWLVALHLAYYYVGSGIAAFKTMPSLEDVPGSMLDAEMAGVFDFPTGIERRGHRYNPDLLAHLHALKNDLGGSVHRWVSSHVIPGDPRGSWTTLQTAVRGVRGWGRWSAYNFVEMMQKVCDFPLEAPDAGHRGSTGPRRGLRLIEGSLPEGNSEKTLDYLDFLTDQWAEEVGETDLARLETSLCSFQSLVNGRYYLGHNIDRDLATLYDPRVTDYIDGDCWEARARSFPEEFRGEVSGWDGIRRDLRTKYRDHGEWL